MDQQTPIIFKSTVNIIVDHRERASKVPEFLAKIGNAELSFTQLSVGDYVVDNLVLFERKTIKDFAQSIIDARLFRQAVRLNRAQMKTAIILEGSFSSSRVGVSREAMQGALISLMLVFGIPVLRAVNAEESARLCNWFLGSGFEWFGQPAVGDTICLHITILNAIMSQRWSLKNMLPKLFSGVITECYGCPKHCAQGLPDGRSTP